MSENVYKHFVRSAVTNITESEVNEILELHPNDNPLNHTNFISNVAQSVDIPKEGPTNFFINVTKMVMSSDDPFRKVFRLAIEYINDDGLTDDETMEESADGLRDLIRYRVECLHDLVFIAEDDYNYFND